MEKVTGGVVENVKRAEKCMARTGLESMTSGLQIIYVFTLFHNVIPDHLIPIINRLVEC